MARVPFCGDKTPIRSGSRLASFSACKEQALVVLLVQQLADAQIVSANQAATERLWQEVAALQLDADRITNLLYCGLDWRDREALLAEDTNWLAKQPIQPQRRWSLASWRSRWTRDQPRTAVCSS